MRLAQPHDVDDLGPRSIGTTVPSSRSPLLRPCPYCGVGAGIRCRQMNGGVLSDRPKKRPHRERMRVYRNRGGGAS